jgi:hypothetical protein
VIDKLLTFILWIFGADKTDAEREHEKTVELYDATQEASKTGDTSRLESWIKKMRGR